MKTTKARLDWLAQLKADTKTMRPPEYRQDNFSTRFMQCDVFKCKEAEEIGISDETPVCPKHTPHRMAWIGSAYLDSSGGFFAFYEPPNSSRQLAR